jgi:hypothetical protein
MLSRFKRSIAFLLALAMAAPARAQRVGSMGLGASAEVRVVPLTAALGGGPSLSVAPAALAVGLSLAPSAPVPGAPLAAVPVAAAPLPASAVPAAAAARTAADATPAPERTSAEAAQAEAARRFDGSPEQAPAADDAVPASAGPEERPAALRARDASVAPRSRPVPSPVATARFAARARILEAIAPALVGAGIVLMIASVAHGALVPAILGAALALAGVYAPRAAALVPAPVLAPAAPRAPPAASAPAPAVAPRTGRYGDPVLDSLVEKHLPAAAASGRKIGLEVEFYGPGREEVMLALRETLGGNFDLGYVEFDPAAPVRKTAEFTYTLDGKGTAFKLRSEHDGVRESFLIESGKTKKIFSSREEAEEFVSKTLGRPIKDFKLRWAEDYTIILSGKVGGRAVEIPFEWSALGEKMVGAGVRRQFSSYSLFAEQVERWRQGRDPFFHGSTVLKDSALGDLFITNETNYALELVTSPLDYEQMPLLRQALGVLRGLGAHDGPHDVGIHVNITVDKKDVDELQNLILAYAAVRKNARAFFRPHSRREHWIGAEKPDLLAALGDPAYRPSLAEFQALMATSSKGKTSDLNMGHAARPSGRPAAEFRLFNLDFDSVEDMVDFSLALTHSAAAAR